MKIYLLDYNIDEREPKRIYVSQYSSYKIGINIIGGDNSSILLQKDANTFITPEGTFKGYSTYSFEAGTPETVSYNIVVNDITFTLYVITTNSTVAELSSGSGSAEVPADLELFSLKVGGEEPTISADASNLYLKGEDFRLCAGESEVIRTGEVYDYNTGETRKGVEIQCDSLTANNYIQFNDLTGNNIMGTSVNAYNNFGAPGLTSYNDLNEYFTRIDMSGKTISMMADSSNGAIVIGEYGEYSTTGDYLLKTGLKIDNITDMTFKDYDANVSYKVVPTDITTSDGITMKVLQLVEITP